MKTFVRRFAVVIALLSSISCVHKYAVPARVGDAEPIRSGSVVYVTLPADGKDHRGREYEGSGMWARDAFSEALTNRGTRTIEATAVRSIEQSPADGTAAGAAFVVLPDISYWADHMTEWSGTPDRITLRVRVLETPAGRSIDDREMKASSKWATFGGDHPQDLLPQLASDWAESIVVR